MADADYHGQAYKPGVEPANAPPAPAHAAKPAAPVRQGISIYPRVVMIGNYGLACAQNQTLEFNNVTLDQAHKYKWQYFGVCGAQMTCYDGNNNAVLEEG